MAAAVIVPGMGALNGWTMVAAEVPHAAAFAVGIPVYKAQRGRMATPSDVPPFR